ncbi:hypothetical protein NG697_12395 [Pseudarthrobacter sp. MDT3-26]|uniref:hypothetical protein n=1 Tax=Pseudarthrobacter raffinosi TaxID=2953651 RepID=UPI00208EFD8A|nr:hypothetical protein [Pseudarthrobacter sp. MDT3-26]MCO4263711.1 hypothetical protein [Pseudarthrobacter sp. MDT3-26]
MKTQSLAVLAAVTVALLTGCAGSQVATDVPAPPAPAIEPVSEGSNPIVIDLANQTMTIPGTQYGSTSIPILAAGDVLAGSSILMAEPADALAYVHCDDRTTAWATEPSAEAAGAWARPLQLVTFDPACLDVASIHGHAIVVPRVVSEHQGEEGGVDQWLTEGREILVIGESPYPDPNKAPITGGKIEWPDDRMVHLRGLNYEPRG